MLTKIDYATNGIEHFESRLPETMQFVAFNTNVPHVLAESDYGHRVKELTLKKGVDVIYDPVGGPFSELALRDMAWKGRFLVVGFAAGEIPKVPLNLTLLKGCSIVGVFWGAFTRKEPENNRSNNEELLQFFVEGKVKPHIYATYPLEEAAQALNDVLYKRVSGKVVLTT